MITLGKCNKCKRKIPTELLAPVMTSMGNTAGVCGICALEISNNVLGVERNKFDGENAEGMRQEAIRYYKKTNQIENETKK